MGSSTVHSHSNAKSRTDAIDIQQLDEYPPRASLEKDVYRPFPTLPGKLPPPEEIDAPALVVQSLRSLTNALGADQVEGIKSCFLTNQSYWRDLLSFTYHIRTFNDADVIASALATLAKQRELVGEFEPILGSVQDVVVSPALRWIEAMFTFTTLRPGARCEGRLMLFPESGNDGKIIWKIWSLSTWLEAFEEFPENMHNLKTTGRDLKSIANIETDVVIVGGGNA